MIGILAENKLILDINSFLFLPNLTLYHLHIIITICIMYNQDLEPLQLQPCRHIVNLLKNQR